MRIIWNLFLIVTGILELIIFAPLVLINIILYFAFKPKNNPQQQSVTVNIVEREKD